jgi:ATP-dependent Clp protease protease subunit
MQKKVDKGAIDLFFETSVDFAGRTICILDHESEAGRNLGVSPTMSELVIKGMHLLQRESEDPIKIILNSFGGCEFNGMAIFHMIEKSPCHVTIDVIGSAMSMGSIILQAADVRRASEYAVLMIHDGYLGMSPVAPKTFEAWADFSKKISRPQLYQIYAKRSGKPASYWEKRCGQDYILTASQALEDGLIDEIIGS